MNMFQRFQPFNRFAPFKAVSDFCTFKQLEPPIRFELLERLERLERVLA